AWCCGCRSRSFRNRSAASRRPTAPATSVPNSGAVGPSRIDQTPPVGKDLAPSQDAHRLAQSGSPERVLLDQRLDLGLIRRLDKPEAPRSLTIRRAQRPGSLHLGRVSLQECQMGGHMRAPDIFAGCGIILKKHNELHDGLAVFADADSRLRKCSLKAKVRSPRLQRCSRRIGMTFATCWLSGEDRR